MSIVFLSNLTIYNIHGVRLMDYSNIRKIIKEELRKEILKEGIGDFFKDLFKKEPTMNDELKDLIEKDERAKSVFEALMEVPSVAYPVREYLWIEEYGNAIKSALRASKEDMENANISDEDRKYLKDRYIRIFKKYH